MKNLSKYLSYSKILILGDPLVDNYIWVKTKKISRESPSIVFEYVDNDFRPGGALNVAKNIHSLQAKHKTIYTKGEKFSINNRIVSDNKLLFRYDEPSIVKLTKKNIDKKISLIKHYYDEGYKTIIISDYGLGNITNYLIKELVKFANHNSKFNLIIDPYIKHAEWYGSKLKSRYKNIILTPNEEEYNAGCNGGNYTIVTMGSKGICIKEKGKTDLMIPSIRKEVADVTGAGDTVIALLALCIDREIEIYEAVKIANEGASIVVSKFGTSVITPEEFKNAFSKTMSK